MSYYNWEEIVETKTDAELKKIFANRTREDKKKIDAVYVELKKRKLISVDQETTYKSKLVLNRVVNITDIKETRPNKKRAVIAQNIIWIILVLEFISIYSSYLQYNLLNSFQNEGFISEQMANNNDLREQVIAIVFFIFTIVSGVTFIQWFRRAYFNLHNRFSNCEFTDGWAAGSWFVPIVSLFRPYKIMKELWVKTNKILKKRSEGQFIFTKTSILGFWWTLWLIYSYIGNYVLRISFKADTIESMLGATVGDMVMSVFGIPLALITIKIINTYSKNEDLLYKKEQYNISSSSTGTQL